MVVFAFAKAQSQDAAPKHQISIQHDNDFLLGIDRYYTTGSFAGYSKTLTGDFIFKNQGELPLQLDIILGQETYTPRALFSSDFRELERPYAGYLFGVVAVSQATHSHIWTLKGEIGLAGPQSLAGAAQRAYHELINELIPEWSGEIGNSLHLNAYANYDLSFQKERKFFIDLNTSVAFGTRQIFAEQSATLFFGNRDPIGASSFYNRIGTNRELYGYGGLYYKYLALNALIQGHPWGDNSPFTLPTVNAVFGAQLGVALRKGANTFQLEFVTQTNETPRERQLQYNRLSYKRSF